jgi:signal transduction histidine kinase
VKAADRESQRAALIGRLQRENEQLRRAAASETAAHRLNEERVRERTSELEAAYLTKDELIQELARRTRIEREFVTNAAHELRTPVAAIASAVQVLESGAKEHPADRDRFLAHVGEQCRRLERLSQALLVLARAQMSQEPPQLEPTELAPLLGNVAAALETRPEVEVRLSCPPGIAALANHGLLEQAVLNVAANAAKYVEQGWIALECSPRDRCVAIAIRDTGPGMTSEDRERAFERFRRGENDLGDGFGLGLSIAAQAVEVLGGTIEIDSAPGVGTTVLLSVPRAA